MKINCNHSKYMIKYSTMIKVEYTVLVMSVNR